MAAVVGAGPLPREQVQEARLGHRDRRLQGKGCEVADLASPATWYSKSSHMVQLSFFSETFIILAGPDGSSKSKVLEPALNDKTHIMNIRLQEVWGKADSDVIATLANQINFWPVFSSLVWLSNIADGLLAATTGQKAILSTNTETQIKKTLECAAIAIRNVTRSLQNEEQKHLAQEDKMSSATVTRKPESSGKPSVKTLKKQEVDVTDLPVVIIRGWMEKDQHQQEKLYNQIVEWASMLVDQKLANVIFVSNNVGIEKMLNKIIPNRTFHEIFMKDSSTEEAVKMVLEDLVKVGKVGSKENSKDGGSTANTKIEEEDIKECVQQLGGRMTDLDQFVRGIKAGATPKGNQGIDMQLLKPTDRFQGRHSCSRPSGNPEESLWR